MLKTRLIWISLLLLFTGVPSLVQARWLHKHKSSTYRSGYEQGYQKGYDDGKSDRSNGSAFDLQGHQSDISTAENVSGISGKKSTFDKGFRTGFDKGYQDGFNGREAQLNPGMAPSSQEGLMPSQLARTEAQPKTSYSAGWNDAYRLGYKGGETDRANGAKFDADDAPGYKGYRSEYQSSFGSKKQFKKGWHKGFMLGYEDGYSGLVSRLITPEQNQNAAASAEQVAPPVAEQAPPAEPRAEQATPQEEQSSEQAASQEPQTAENVPTQQPQNTPRSLPKTGSDLPLIALFGLASIGASLVVRAFRQDSA